MAGEDVIFRGKNNPTSWQSGFTGDLEEFRRLISEFKQCRTATSRVCGKDMLLQNLFPTGKSPEYSKTMATQAYACDPTIGANWCEFV
jgi:hypothetical protein